MHSPVFMHTHTCVHDIPLHTHVHDDTSTAPALHTAMCMPHMQNFHLQAPCTQPRAMHALMFSTISAHPRMHAYLHSQFKDKMLLARHSQHAGGGQRQEERRPLTLIHSPLLNERIGAQLEPHPEMWIAVGFLVGGRWGSWDGDGGPLRYCGSPRSRGGRG